MPRALGTQRHLETTPLSRERLAECLGSEFRTGPDERECVDRIQLDTLDWRLYRAGRALSSERGPRGARLVWRSLDGDAERESLDLEVAPRFAWQLPAGPLRESLRRVARERALLPQLVLSFDLVRTPVLDAEGVVAAWIVRERVRARANGDGREQPLPACVELQERRGQRQAFLALGRAIQALGLERAAPDPLVAALAALGIEPSAPPPLAPAELDPDAPAAAAARAILLPLFDAMEANQPGVALDLDPECLHDYRVALRRARSAAKLLRAVLPPEADALRSELRWLARLTGPVRDLDVQLLSLADSRDALPEALRSGLERLAEQVARRRRAARSGLEAALEGPRHRALLQGWRKLLDRVPSSASDATVAALAARSIAKLYRRVRKFGRKLGKGASYEELHELRVRCKELRYAIDAFRSLFPAKRVERSLRPLARLQDSLGVLHDCDVQIAALEALSAELAGSAEGERPLLAAGALIERLDRRRAKAAARSGARIERLCSPAAERHFAAGFAAAPAAPQPPAEAR